MTLIDLSHIIEDGLITYKGLPAPLICDYLSRDESKNHYAENTTFQIGKIDMVANTGTYIDAPFHRFENGKDISQLNLKAIANLDAIKISIDEKVKSINEKHLREKLKEQHLKEQHLKEQPLKNKALLIHTGWSQFWNTDQYFEDHPHLTECAAQYIKDEGCQLVGIDSLNIDSTKSKERPVHSILLGNDILIVEHMCNIEQLPNHGFKFFAVPAKIKGLGSFPVRAFATV